MRVRVVTMTVGTDVRMVAVIANAEDVKTEPTELHEFVESLALHPPPMPDERARATRTPALDVLVRDPNGAKCY